MKHITIHTTMIVLAVFLSVLLAACDSSEIEDFGEKLDASVCAPDAGPFTLQIDNPFSPWPVGQQIVLDGDDDGEQIRVEITVLDETEIVAGVTTRVVEESEWEDGELVEVSRNFFAQAPDGTVCYFGEDVDDYEDGQVVGHGGEWRADGVRNFPGILMAADPQPGMAWDLEIAPGVAEDEFKVLSIGETVTVPAGQFTGTMRAKEQNRLDGDSDEKVFAPGVGIIDDAGIPMVEFTPGDAL